MQRTTWSGLGPLRQQYFPGIWQWGLDASVFKNIPIKERFRFRLQADFFNVLNHANFENPRNSTSGSAALTSLTFGQTCCSAASLPSSATVIAIGEPNRVIQLGVKLNF